MYDEKRIYDDTQQNVPAECPLQVPDALNGMDNAIERLSKTTAEVHSRLSPVLRNEPEAAGSKDVAETTLVSLAERIREAARRIERTDAAYQSMLRRLEV